MKLRLVLAALLITLFAGAAVSANSNGGGAIVSHDGSMSDPYMHESFFWEFSEESTDEAENDKTQDNELSDDDNEGFGTDEESLELVEKIMSATKLDKEQSVIDHLVQKVDKKRSEYEDQVSKIRSMGLEFKDERLKIRDMKSQINRMKLDPNVSKLELDKKQKERNDKKSALKVKGKCIIKEMRKLESKIDEFNSTAIELAFRQKHLTLKTLRITLALHGLR